jgi:hypothetical protein
MEALCLYYLKDVGFVSLIIFGPFVWTKMDNQLRLLEFDVDPRLNSKIALLDLLYPFLHLSLLEIFNLLSVVCNKL